MKNNYSTYSKEQLIKRIEELETKNKTDHLDADDLYKWLLTRKRGDFVRATANDITEHFNCTRNNYSKAMKQLYSDGRLYINKFEGKRVVSSHGIK